LSCVHLIDFPLGANSRKCSCKYSCMGNLGSSAVSKFLKPIFGNNQANAHSVYREQQVKKCLETISCLVRVRRRNVVGYKSFQASNHRNSSSLVEWQPPSTIWAWTRADLPVETCLDKILLDRRFLSIVFCNNNFENLPIFDGYYTYTACLSKNFYEFEAYQSFVVSIPWPRI
jgi:hypothetical protein